MELEFALKILEKCSNIRLMKTLQLEAELFHAHRRTASHDEANSRFSQFCEKRLRKK